MILFLIIYFPGCVLSYLIGRKFLKKDSIYMLSDRKFNLLMSLFSWISLIAIFLVWGIETKNDRPVKW